MWSEMWHNVHLEALMKDSLVHSQTPQQSLVHLGWLLLIVYLLNLLV